MADQSGAAGNEGKAPHDLGRQLAPGAKFVAGGDVRYEDVYTAAIVSPVGRLHLVGASNGFVRQPFLYLGFWYGLLGALLALILLGLCMIYLAPPLERLLDAYGNTFAVRGLGAGGGLLVLLSGGLLGLLGAWVSVQRYLRQFRLPESRGKG